MIIQTKLFGECEIDQKEIITFKNGLPGFEENRAFVLIRSGNSGDDLMWLQSTKEPSLAFVVARPEIIKPGYSPKVRESELADIELKNSEDALVLVIAVVPEDIKKMTVNLRAPLIVNSKNRLGKQVVLEDDSYSIKEPVFNPEK
ncbi:MAG TPA: flagellar assembly protein FliW [Bacillota bacterium]|nr:flagellar assembly protein FliW [Bacillota bacterium]